MNDARARPDLGHGLPLTKGWGAVFSTLRTIAALFPRGAGTFVSLGRCPTGRGAWSVMMSQNPQNPNQGQPKPGQQQGGNQPKPGQQNQQPGQGGQHQGGQHDQQGGQHGGQQGGDRNR